MKIVVLDENGKDLPVWERYKIKTMEDLKKASSQSQGKDLKRVLAAKKAWVTMRRNGRSLFDGKLKQSGLAMWLLKKWAGENLANQNWQEMIDDELTYGEMKSILLDHEKGDGGVLLGS